MIPNDILHVLFPNIILIFYYIGDSYGSAVDLYFFTADVLGHYKLQEVKFCLRMTHKTEIDFFLVHQFLLQMFDWILVFFFFWDCVYVAFMEPFFQLFIAIVNLFAIQHPFLFCSGGRNSSIQFGNT